MRVELTAGELMLVGFFGRSLSRQLQSHLLRLRPAGLVFFRRNVDSPQQVARLAADLQQFAHENFGRPLLLAIDQEGGKVARLGPPFLQLPAAADLGAQGPPAVALLYRQMARQMHLVGLGVNLAPVLDLDLAGPGAPMYARSFGPSPEHVAQCAAAALSAMEVEKVLATAKHFPGLGRAREDSHTELPVIEAPASELLAADLFPYRSLFSRGLHLLMTAHALYPRLDADFPATFSKKILTNLLRHQLRYQGLVITDDLEMGAVQGSQSIEAAAVAALRAGADLLLVCNDPPSMYRVAAAVDDAVNTGGLDLETVARSRRRLLALLAAFPESFSPPDLAAVQAHFSFGEKQRG